MSKLPKDNRLNVVWSKVEKDIMYRAGKGCYRDIHIFHYALTQKRWTSKGICGELEDSLKEQLEKAGYDIKTLKITIDKLKSKL